MVQIIQAANGADIDDARAIFREYEQWLGLSLCFQSFEEELATLPGKYTPPDGRLYLARIDGEIVGCIAMRRIGVDVCEMKRLYLRESARGKGVGLTLIEKVIDDARSIGYTKMRLDTYPPKMGKAVRLYESHGFYEIPSYYDNPHGKTLFMEKLL
ncbi:MAG TPA: GNAT family N-acetyltransferase [Pyrinomonadaceae bacterium]